MLITEFIRGKIIKQYCIIFLLIILYKFFTKAFLFQLPPFLFYNKLDFSSWLVMSTGIHKYFLNNFPLCLAVETIYCIIPFVYFFLLPAYSQGRTSYRLDCFDRKFCLCNYLLLLSHRLLGRSYRSYFVSCALYL